MSRRLPARPLDPERAWDYLLTLLTRRDYTLDELRRRLVGRGIEAARAEDLLVRLRELGLADDRAYSERWVAARKHSRGRIALRAELRRKGVDEELVERGVGGLDPTQQAAAAAELLRRFAWRYRPADAVADSASGAPSEAAERERRNTLRRSRARAFAFLARRGFGAEAAAAALEEVGWWDGPGGEP